MQATAVPMGTQRMPLDWQSPMVREAPSLWHSPKSACWFQLRNSHTISNTPARTPGCVSQSNRTFPTLLSLISSRQRCVRQDETFRQDKWRNTGAGLQLEQTAQKRLTDIPSAGGALRRERVRGCWVPGETHDPSNSGHIQPLFQFQR